MRNFKLPVLSGVILSTLTFLMPLSASANPLSINAAVRVENSSPYEEVVPSENGYSQEMLNDIENMKNRDLDIQELFSDNSLYNSFKSFILTHNPKIKNSTLDTIIKSVKKYSSENDLDPKLVLALIAKESSFRANAVSHTGAMGLGQLKDFTAREVGVKHPFNIVENIKGTTIYLGKLVKYFSGDIYKAVASYNMGAGGVERTLKAGKNLPVDVQRYVYKIKNFQSTIDTL